MVLLLCGRGCECIYYYIYSLSWIMKDREFRAAAIGGFGPIIQQMSTTGMHSVQHGVYIPAHGKFGVRQSVADGNTHMVSAARLVALKRGETKVRPVAVGEIFRRLAASCVIRSRKGAIEQRCLRAKNLAFSRDGCPIAKRTIELLLQDHPEWLCVETDLSSAFQRACRADILLELFREDELRDLIPLFLSLYDGDSHLFFGEFSEMLSQEGSQQGCPLGGLLFVLSIATIVEEISLEFPTVTVVGLADDYRFVGPCLDAMDAAAAYRQRVEAVGHVFQVSKSWYFSHFPETLELAAAHPLGQERDSEGQGMKAATPETGLRILGAPYGDADWCRQWLGEYGDGVQKVLDAIVELTDHDNSNAAQAAFLLLRFSASTKVSHLLRMVPPSLMMGAAKRHDDAVAECLSLMLDKRRHPLQDLEDCEDEEVFGNDARFLARTQCYLPVKAGGLGLGCAATTAEPAYIAGWVDFLHFVGANEEVFPAVTRLVQPAALESSPLFAIEQLRDAWDYMDCTGLSRPSVDNPGEMLPGALEMQEVLGEQVSGVGSLHAAKGGAQKGLSAARMRGLERFWREEAAKHGWEGEVRLTACGGKEAAWVTAVPSRPEYQLTSKQWRASFAMRLGMPQEFLVGKNSPSTCTCHAAFSARSGAIARGEAGAQRPSETGRRRTRRPPPRVDVFGEHDQRCSAAFPLGRHNRIQVRTADQLKKAGKFVRKASLCARHAARSLRPLTIAG